MASGGGCEGDCVAEGFKFSDVTADAAVVVDVGVVVVDAEVAKSCGGVGEEVLAPHLATPGELLRCRRGGRRPC